MAGPALAEGTRVGGGEAVCGSWRTLCAGQKRRSAYERESHAEEKTGSVVAQVAGHAAQWSATGPAVVTHWRRTKRSGDRFSFPAPANPKRRPSGDPPELSVS